MSSKTSSRSTFTMVPSTMSPSLKYLMVSSIAARKASSEPMSLTATCGVEVASVLLVMCGWTPVRTWIEVWTRCENTFDSDPTGNARMGGPPHQRCGRPLIRTSTGRSSPTPGEPRIECVHANPQRSPQPMGGLPRGQFETRGAPISILLRLCEWLSREQTHLSGTLTGVHHGCYKPRLRL